MSRKKPLTERFEVGLELNLIWAAHHSVDIAATLEPGYFAKG